MRKPLIVFGFLYQITYISGMDYCIETGLLLIVEGCLLSNSGTSGRLLFFFHIQDVPQSISSLFEKI